MLNAPKIKELGQNLMYSDVERKTLEKLIGEFEEFKRKSAIIAEAAAKSISWSDASLDIENCNNQFGIFEDGTYYGNFCRKRICPMCQRRKSIKTYAELKQCVDEIGGSFILGTFTVKNCTAAELDKTITKMFLAFSELWREKFKKHFNGCFRALEVTYNENRDDFHPHFHCIFSVNKSYFTSRKYLSQAEILKLWREKFGGKNGGVDLRKIQDIENGVAEVAKYCVKPFDISDENLTARLLDNLFKTLKNRRLIQTYGNIKAALTKIFEEYESAEKRSAADCEKWYIYNKNLGVYEN